MFLIHGQLGAVHYAETRQGLLDELNQAASNQPPRSTRAIAAKRMGELLTAPDSSLFAEGEDIYNFAGIANGEVVCGNFEYANCLKAGDNIDAVVSRRSGVLFAHGVRRTSDHLFLLPKDALAGQDALYRRCMRFAWRMTVFLWIVFGTGQLVYNIMYPESGQSYLFDVIVTLIAPPLLMFGTEMLTYRKMDGAGEYAKTIFETFNIPRADSFDALPGMDFFKQDYRSFFAVNADKALKHHGKKFKLPAHSG
jgi:hypothetical protein